MPKVNLFHPAASEDLIKDTTSPRNPNSTKHMLNTLFERPFQPLFAINLYSLQIIAYVRAICTFIFLAGLRNHGNKQGRRRQTPPGSSQSSREHCKHLVMSGCQSGIHSQDLIIELIILQPDGTGWYVKFVLQITSKHCFVEGFFETLPHSQIHLKHHFKYLECF